MESSSRTLVCSVLFLDIVEYSKKPVAEQLQLKQAFNRVLAEALEQVPPRDRIILDTGDGAAVTFMGDPEDALFAAMAMRDMASGAHAGAPGRQPRAGAPGEGPERPDEHHRRRHQRRAARDELRAPRPAAGLALVLRSRVVPVARLRESVPPRGLAHRQARARARGLLGGRRRADGAPRVADRVESRDAATRGWLAGMRPARRCAARRCSPRRSPSSLVVGGAVAARSRCSTHPAAPAAQQARLRPAPPPSQVRARTPRGAAWRRSPSGRTTSRRRPSSPASSSRSLPWGEVLVDGKSRGVSPPLRTLDIPAGSHTIEIRNSTFPSHVEKVNVKAGEAIRIRHRFQK